MAKRLLFTGLYLLLTLMVQDGYTEIRGIKVVTRTSDGEELKLYDNSWAVIIGVDQYQKWSSLQYAVNDAKAVRDKLVTLGFPKANIIFLTDAQATKDRIERVLGDELRRKMGKNDRVFIYFAGHGQTEDLPGDKQEGYIVPVDGDPSNLFSTCISMTTVRQFSERMAAKHVFYAIDACYSGLALVRAGELNLKDKQYLQKVARFPARQLVTAGSAGEQVIERGGHGAFTKTLLIALDGSADKFPPFGVLTGSELGNYLKPVVSMETNNAQTPQFGRLSAGEGEFMFVLEGGITEQVSAAERAKGEAEAAKREVERLRQQLETEKARKETEKAKAEAERLRLKLGQVKEVSATYVSGTWVEIGPNEEKYFGLDTKHNQLLTFEASNSDWWIIEKNGSPHTRGKKKKYYVSDIPGALIVKAGEQGVRLKVLFSPTASIPSTYVSGTPVHLEPNEVKFFGLRLRANQVVQYRTDVPDWYILERDRNVRINKKRTWRQTDLAGVVIVKGGVHPMTLWVDLK